MRKKQNPAEAAAVAEKALRARNALDRYGLSYLWLRQQLWKWEGLVVDTTTISKCLTGMRTCGVHAEYVEASLRVLTRYARMYADRTPAAEPARPTAE